MNAYVLSVIGTVVFSTILTCIIPEGKTASLIKGIAKTACVAVIVAPILQFFHTGDIPTFFYQNVQEIFSQSGIETNSEFIQYYSETRLKEAQEKLQRELFEKYAIEAKVTLEWIWKEKDGKEEMYIVKIKVSDMEDQTDEKKNEIREYLSKNYCSEVQIE